MDVVEEIKRKLDLPEYVGRSVALHKSGRSFRGLCPFHAEKTPSFYVFPDRGTWRCFGSCGEGGDLFSFVQKRDNLDFRAALRQLAAEAGVQLSAEASQRRSRVEKLAAVTSAAVDFYQRCLKEPRGEAARTYVFETRGLTAEAVEAFRIGWAPDEWHVLRDYLAGRGYDQQDALDAGLLVESESRGQPHDRFRGRVIIPIADERGQYVGMGGRGLHGEEPKYLNSPQSELFDKGRTLFGLNLAADAIKAAGAVVVVEGYMDVIGPWQAGFRNVVATMGTSLTEHHAGLLKRHARRVVLAMDPDAAGMAAAERAGEVVGMSEGWSRYGRQYWLRTTEDLGRAARDASALTRETGLELLFAPLPSGKDPDEVARNNPSEWQQAIDDALPFIEYLLRRTVGGIKPQSSPEISDVLDRLQPVFDAVPDPVERSRYIGRIARQLGVPEKDISDRMVERAHRRKRPRREPPDWESRPAPSPEEALLALLLHHPQLRHELRNLPADLFASAINREVFVHWLRDEQPGENAGDDPVAAHAGRLQQRRLPPLSQSEARRAVEAKIREIGRERLIQRQAAVTEELAEAERTLGANRVAELSNEAWLGALPPDDAMLLAETVIEELELGLSIHRREGNFPG